MERTIATLWAEDVEAVDTVDLAGQWQPARGFLFDRSGRGVAGIGVAAEAGLAPGAGQLAAAADHAERLLAGVEGPGRETVAAVGALPFDGAVAARLTVPAQLLRRQGDEAQKVSVAKCDPGDGQAAPEAVAAGHHALTALSRQAGPVRGWPDPEPAVYREMVAEALRRIHAGELRKVVLARTLVVEGDALADACGIVSRLRQGDPDCYTFAVSTGGESPSLMVGATPELLVRRRGSRVLSTPLGGSTPRRPDPSDDRAAAKRLLASDKDRREHALVVEAITDTLAPYCTALEVAEGFQLTSTAGMWHLGSTVRGTLSPAAPSALGLAAALHPTPAICGTPRQAAMTAIHELEAVPRGLYSGIVGWVDARGDGEWAISLRCAELTPSGARLYAGAGIVEGSDPASEVVETDAKFGAFLDALRI
ncbi:MAG: isochorismate synthase MenF [Candidatus Dormibacteria bacterium]